jgi:hypothetical protein
MFRTMASYESVGDTGDLRVGYTQKKEIKELEQSIRIPIDKTRINQLRSI